ncbi:MULTISPECIES: helix-turn-helix domain-containing protein [unclassified Vibrio]|uniref:Helix-turn-helix domain-containing protein n=1 Tax=Vibrio sp. HB236076 TaxID=3232307 RepID=A0AB39HIL6_9VIBR|nr:helix-turn-helix domain-containing protein [Vibrio sp. HB161653]MDP5254640.1 helix-turn-helix domain-containing protein [Vibrio sp. HB161653]
MDKDTPTQRLIQSVASHLKKTREKQGLSLEATAKRTGVSKAMLGQIERSESNPTIATLWKIANGLNTSFSAFLAKSDTEAYHGGVVDEEGIQIKTLFPYHPQTHIESFVITLTHFHQQLSPAHAIGVIEYLYVLEGEIAVLHDGVWQRLNAGDALQFHGDQPHGYQAMTEKCVFHNTIYYP